MDKVGGEEVRKKQKLPVEWKEARLKDLGVCLVGLTYSPSNLVGKNTEGVLVLRSSNIQNGRLDYQDNVYVSKNIKINNYTQLDDILVCVRNGSKNLIGKNTLITKEAVGMAHGAFMLLFRSRYNKYLRQLFCSDMYYKQVHRNLGATINSINSSDFYKFKFYFPPLPEQKAIADLLSTWDKAIEIIERLIQAKEKRFKALLDELITKPSKSGKWKKVKLGDVCKITKGKQLNVAHMKDDGIYYALNGGIEPSGRTDDWNTEAETITISEGGNSCGYVNYNIERFWLGGHCYSLLDFKETVDKQYLYFYLKVNERKLMKLRVGSGLPNIQKKDVDKFSVFLPTLSEQQLIAQMLFTIQQEIDLLKQLAEKYKIQKRGLMQKLLTGKWRVKSEVVDFFEEKEHEN